MGGIVVSIETDYRFGEVLDLLEDAEQGEQIHGGDFRALSVTDTRDRPEVDYDFLLELSTSEEDSEDYLLSVLTDYVPLFGYTVEREFDE